MKEFITIIINKKLKVFFRQKGQGLVEIALILALCAGIGLAAREMGFLDAISSVFDFGEQPEYVTAAIGGGTGGNPGGNTGDNPGGNTGDNPGGNTGDNPGGNTGDNPGGNTGDNPGGNTGDNPGGNTGDNPGGNNGGGGLVDWGAQNPYDYFEDGVSQEERLAKDQEALVNIAKHFLTLTQSQVQALMKNNQTADMGYYGSNGINTGEELMLGHFRPSTNQNTGMKFETDGTLKADEAQNIFLWMQGDVENPTYDPTNMYLVSDYVVSQDWVKEAGIQAGGNQKNGLRLRLEYDYSGKYAPEGGYENAGDVKVIGVHLAIDPKSQDNELLGNSSNYNRKSSSGLEVQVRINADGGYDISKEDTVRHIDASNQNSSTSFYNWYGEGDYQLVKQYIENQAEVINKTFTDREFTKGEIIKVGSQYYIAIKDGTKTVSSSSSQASLEYDPNDNNKKSNIFVKFTGMNKRYLHENEKTAFDETNHVYKQQIIEDRGVLMTMDNGDIFVYVGDRKNVTFDETDIDNDWIKIRG